MRVIEPTFQGKYFFHHPQPAADLGKTLARCISCRKPKLYNQFGQIFIGRGRLVLAAVCFQCRRLERRLDSASHPLYTPELGLFFDRLCLHALQGARARGWEFLLSPEDLLQKYLQNEGRCEVSGVVLRPFDRAVGTKSRLRPSIDRINSLLGYRHDNFQIVAVIINTMKADLTSDQFLSWCKRVVAQSAKKTDDLLSEIEL